MRDFTQKTVFFFTIFNCFTCWDNPLSQFNMRLNEVRGNVAINCTYTAWWAGAIQWPLYQPPDYPTFFDVQRFLITTIWGSVAGKKKEISGWVKIAFNLKFYPRFLAWNHVAHLWKWQLSITSRSRIFECGHQKIVFFQPSDLHEYYSRVTWAVV